jgi:acyl carrier protein
MSSFRIGVESLLAGASDTMTIRDPIVQFVVDEIAIDGPIAHDHDLIDSDLLDSAGIVALLGFLEETFEISIDEDLDLVPENFQTIDAIVFFVSAKLSSSKTRSS